MKSEYQDWLQRTVYHSDDILQIHPLTNQQITDMPTEDRPQGWINFTNDKELDKFREGFKGGCLKWKQYVEENIPFLDPWEERRIKKEIDKKRKLEKCGELVNRLNKQGIYKLVPQWCNNYKECPKCKARRQQEHFDRLMKLDGQPFIVGNRPEAVAHYHQLGIKTYSFKWIDGQDVTVIVTDQPVEGAAGEVTYEMAKQEIRVTGTKVSGEAGKEPLPTSSIFDETEKVLLTSCTFQATEAVKQQIEKEYLEETKDMIPTSVINLTHLLIKCQQIYFAIVQKYCEEIHFVSKYYLYVNQDDLDWTPRQEYIEKRLLRLESMQKRH